MERKRALRTVQIGCRPVDGSPGIRLKVGRDSAILTAAEALKVADGIVDRIERQHTEREQEAAA